MLCKKVLFAFFPNNFSKILVYYVCDQIFVVLCTVHFNLDLTF